MPTKKNKDVSVDLTEKIESEPNEEKTREEIELAQLEAISGYTIDECEKELEAMEIWYRNRKETLKSRIRELNNEANDKEMRETIKRLRDNLISTGLDKDAVDEFILDNLRKNLGVDIRQKTSPSKVKYIDVELANDALRYASKTTNRTSWDRE